ncbi:hypothetical protein A9Q89_00285 [Gammaproteobacteria bacterium 53_120_T64]|nr:hypothetical protein A9Q89_00285 [Gammaproteobacteria bacterium 53_120_T64]
MFLLKQVVIFSLLLVMSVLNGGYAEAAVTSKERRSIGLEGTLLTPSGAVRAGNAEGTIPEWKNEVLPLPEDFLPGTFHPDPFAADKVRLKLTSENYMQYVDKLSLGQQKMFKTYDDYFMNVYPTRRSAVYKPHVYEAALKNLERSEFRETDSHMGMIGFTGARRAWAFPIPHNADEAMLNHQSRPRLVWNKSREVTIPVASDGSYEVSHLDVEFHNKWSDIEVAEGDLSARPMDTVLFYSQTLTGPARVAGQVVLALEPLTFTDTFRKAWSYSPGQRRVKRAPQIIYDNPMTASDGLGTTDQVFGFNGPTDRFSYKLLGKREIFVPYNPYKLFAQEVTPDKVIAASGRFNQDYARYELHRVWIIEAVLKEGTSHEYSKRVFYLDEDSWEVMLADNYDRRGGLWRHWEDHQIFYYDVGSIHRAAELQYDFDAHRMLALLIGKSKAPDFSWRAGDEYFTSSAVRRRGVR